MQRLLHLVARALVALLQALPLRVVARLGRAGGAVAHALDARHRNMARKNLAAAFPETSEVEIRALARENFRRIGENFACSVKTAGMDAAEITPILSVTGAEKFFAASQARQSVVVAVGHFGNFELYARGTLAVKGYQFATTYRGLRQPALNELLQSLREKSGCLFFERRSDAAALKAAMSKGGLMLGLLADQHAGDRGLRLPFLGRECSTSAAPAVFALRYHCPLHTAVCFREDLARWRVEIGDEIPTHAGGQPRSVEDIMRDVNRVFEQAVQRDPANWFWVHNRWKEGKWRAKEAALVEKSGSENPDASGSSSSSFSSSKSRHGIEDEDEDEKSRRGFQATPEGKRP